MSYYCVVYVLLLSTREDSQHYTGKYLIDKLREEGF